MTLGEVVVRKAFDLPSPLVAARCGRFDTLPEWHPAFESARIEGAGDDRVRVLSMGGAQVREQLVAESESGYSYRVLSHPLPIRAAKGQVLVSEAEGGGAVLTWCLEFEPAGVLPEDMLAKAIEGVLRMGLEAVTAELSMMSAMALRPDGEWGETTLPGGRPEVTQIAAPQADWDDATHIEEPAPLKGGGE